MTVGIKGEKCLLFYIDQKSAYSIRTYILNSNYYIKIMNIFLELETWFHASLTEKNECKKKQTREISDVIESVYTPLLDHLIQDTYLQKG